MSIFQGRYKPYPKPGLDTQKELQITMDALEILTRRGAVYQGLGCYFVSTFTDPDSGLHTLLLDSYVNCETVFPHQEEMWWLAQQLVAKFDHAEYDTIACASTGDIAVACAVSHYLAVVENHVVGTVWADKQSDKSYQIERSGYEDVVAASNGVLVINDRISNGGTTRKVVAEVERCGGRVIGVTALSTPSDLSLEDIGAPRLETLSLTDTNRLYLADATEAQRMLPVAVDPAVGHGATFRQENPDWPGGFVSVQENLGRLTPA